ncbi:3463_t:CDS:2, partial [Rhizophagus irregularis]
TIFTNERMKFKQYQPARSRQLNPSRHSSSQKGYICPQTRFDVSADL